MPLFYNSAPYLLYFVLFCGMLLYAHSATYAKKTYEPTTIFAIFLLIARGSAILNNVCLNPDEAQVLAQAMTIKVNPVMYQSFDGATAGPVHSYFALLPHALGLPLNYATLHFLTVIIQTICLWLIIKTLTTIWGLRVAVFATLPMVACLFFTTENAFIHYASEQTPMLVLCLMLWLLLSSVKTQNLGEAKNFFIGFLSILIFFCKLQAVPMAFVVVVYAFYQNLKHQKWLLRNGLIVLGAISCSLLVLTLCFYWHVAHEVYLFYFKGNFIHQNTTDQSIWQFVANYFSAAFRELIEVKTMAMSLIISLLLFFIKPAKIDSFQKQLLIFILLLTAATAFAIGKSGFVFYHYLNYTLLTSTLLCGWLLGNIKTPFPTKGKGAVFPSLKGEEVGFNLIFLIPIIATLPYFVHIANTKAPYPYVYLTQPKPISNVAKAILKYGKAGEPLAVWGWGVEYYYETQMPQGTTDNHTIRCFLFSLVEEHRERYMWDMELKRPVVFVDDVTKKSFWMNDPATSGMEKFPDLNTFVRKNYTLAEIVDGRRIFVRNDIYKTRI